MTVVSAENRAYWENLQKRRKIQVLDPRDSALLLSRDLFPAKKRAAVPKPKAAVPIEKKGGSLLERLQKVDEKEIKSVNLLGKRPRESAEKKKEQEDEELRKKRRLHEDQLRKRRTEEIKKQKEADENRKKKLEDAKSKKQEDDREQARAAARKSLEDMEVKAKENVQDHYTIMKDFAKIIDNAPSEFNYFYP